VTSDEFETAGRSGAEVRWRAADGVVAEASGDRAVVLHADGASLSTLSPSGAQLWWWLPASRAELLARLCGAHPEVDVATLGRDLDAFLDEIRGHGLIVSVDAGC
jgi:hypothetical protein